MSRLLPVLSLTLLLVSLSACTNTSTSPVAPTNPRTVAHQGSGGGSDDGDRDCRQEFAVEVVCPPDQVDIVKRLVGEFRIDTCLDASSPFDAAMKLQALRRPENLEVLATLDPTATIPTYTGSRTFRRGNERRGATTEWTMTAGITTSSVAPAQVDGTLDRLRIRWFMDETGQRIEQTDTLHCTFGGAVEADDRGRDDDDDD